MSPLARSLASSLAVVAATACAAGTPRSAPAQGARARPAAAGSEISEDTLLAAVRDSAARLRAVDRTGTSAGPARHDLPALAARAGERTVWKTFVTALRDDDPYVGWVAVWQLTRSRWEAARQVGSPLPLLCTEPALARSFVAAAERLGEPAPRERGPALEVVGALAACVDFDALDLWPHAESIAKDHPSGALRNEFVGALAKYHPDSPRVAPLLRELSSDRVVGLAAFSELAVLPEADPASSCDVLERAPRRELVQAAFALNGKCADRLVAFVSRQPYRDLEVPGELVFEQAARLCAGAPYERERAALAEFADGWVARFGAATPSREDAARREEAARRASAACRASP